MRRICWPVFDALKSYTSALQVRDTDAMLRSIAMNDTTHLSHLADCKIGRRDGTLLVVSCGLMRSGSTWQFNALRLLLRHLGIAVQFGAGNAREKLSKGTNLLMKIHNYNQWLSDRADYIFTCHRDLRDACASLTRFHPNRMPPCTEKMSEEFENYRRLGCAKHIMTCDMNA